MTKLYANENECIHCKRCTKNCLFLTQYQLDVQGFSQNPNLAFSCFLCGKCKEVCPKKIDGAYIAHQMRQEQKNQQQAHKLFSFLLFEKNPYKFANLKKAKQKSVLYPGCNFVGFYPKTTAHLETLMQKHGIGIAYDCCQKPISDVGLAQKAQNTFQRTEEKLKAQGVEELILVCPNCYHFLQHKTSLKLVSIYEKLQELNEGMPIDKDALPLYYPCPDHATKTMFAHIKPFVHGEIINAFEHVQCCGLGGCAGVKEPQLAKTMAQSVQSATVPLYTYCASCVSNFKRQGFRQAYHLLPLILGIEEEMPKGMLPLLHRAKKIF